MRLFSLLGALLLAGGVFFIIDGGLRMARCMDTGVFSLTVWSEEFWLLIPSKPGLGLSPNAHWFLRIIGGVIAAAIGGRVLRVATR